jgi:hypothetical protein
MKKLILVLAITAMAFAGVAEAQKPTAILGPGLNSGRTDYFQTWDRTLSADTLYILTGLYYVDSTYTINIPAGTTIRGDTAATLIIRRGAQIFAEGEPFNPVVMTSNQPAGLRASGDWGGLVILGQAPVNKFEPLIEGGLIFGSFGGNDPNDNSGVVKYTRLEYPGYRFQLNNEINGLTMGGVGAGTEVHHVQVSYADDDAVECFGGTVNMHHMVFMGTTDDGLDTDFGYRANVQFLFDIRDEFQSDPTGESRGMESDNDGSGTLATPITHPNISNATIIGPERTDAMVGTWFGSFDYSATVRRCSQLSLYNSVIMGWPYGLSLRDGCSQDSASAGVMQWRNVSVEASLPKVPGSVHDEGRWADVTTWFNTGGFNNIGSTPRLPDDIMLNDISDLFNPDPRPMPGSELLASADFANPVLAGFEVTTYRGAFAGTADVHQNALWTREWCNFNPQDTDYDGGAPPVGVKTNSLKAAELGQNYPNPFNPQTSIDYVVRTASNVTLEVFNARGELVKTLVDGTVEPGAYTVGFNATGLSSGIYFYRLSGVGFSETRKMVLVK